MIETTNNKVIPFPQTNLQVEDNFLSIASEYFDQVNDTSLAIYGAVNKESGQLSLVTREEVASTLIGFVNQINQQWRNNNAIAK